MFRAKRKTKLSALAANRLSKESKKLSKASKKLSNKLQSEVNQ